MASWEESHGTPTWTVALHGTSIRAASRILKSEFEPARNETAGVSGVYLEGIHRMENVLQYVTHTHDEPLPLNFVAGVILEAMIDPHFTKTVHREWVQPDPHSVVVVAALVHIVDVQAVDHCRGFLWWLRVARRTVEDFEEVVSLQAAET